ncbi:tyrosine-type recombinase/integrase [Streptomyces sp. NPDC018833]|uniref:tyrosine-type recombinase/integrase n=1 Tax=Streptomyces sp. NPDC018833 TaxID=3365053 RepID=UPI003796ECD0
MRQAHLKACPAPSRALADTSDGTRRERKVRLAFTTDSGDPVQRSPCARTWRRIVKEASAKEAIRDGITLHTLRHTYASLLIKHGESVKGVRKRLGHSSAAVTPDTYSHLWPDSDSTTRRAVEQGLSETQGEKPGAAPGQTEPRKVPVTIRSFGR